MKFNNRYSLLLQLLKEEAEMRIGQHEFIAGMNACFIDTIGLHVEKDYDLHIDPIYVSRKKWIEGFIDKRYGKGNA